MKLIKDSTIYFSASIFQRLIAFILMPFLTRLLSVEEYGTVALFVVFISIYVLVIGGTLNGFVRVIYHKSTSSEFVNYLSNVLVIFLFFSLIVYLFTETFKFQMSELFNIDHYYIVLAFYAAFFRFLFQVRLIIYQTSRNAVKYAKFQIFYSVSELILAVVLVFYLFKNADGRMMSILISTIIMGFIAVYSLHKEKLLKVNINSDYIKRIIIYFVPLLPHSIALTASFTVDKIILSSGPGLAIVGGLAVALSLASPMWLITESVNTAFMPWSFEKYKQGKLDLVVGASYVLLALMFVCCVLYSVLIYLSFSIIIGDAFQDSLYPALILIWIGWLKLAYYLVVKAVVYSESTSYMPLISIISGAVYLVLLYINLDQITLIDVSIYMVYMNIIMFVGMFILSQINFPQPWYSKIGVKEVSGLLVDYFWLNYKKTKRTEH